MINARFPRLVLTGLILVSVQAMAEPKAPSIPERKVQLDFKALTEPLQDLTAADHRIIDRAIQSIRQNEHSVALAYLTGLTATNPMNSGVRILRAYVLLELGNIAGALGEAMTAESTGAHSGYRCWFLAQVAYLAGNKPLCRREISHVEGDASYRPQTE